MAKTQYLNVRGKFAWFYKLYTPDEFRGSSNYTVNFYPADDAEWEKIRKAGIQLRPKEDDGSRSGVQGRYLGLKRPTQRTFGKDVVFFSPPFIYGPDGKPLVRYLDKAGKPLYQAKEEGAWTVEGEQIVAGNGSEGEVRLSYYPTAMGTGNRLESIKLTDIIEYEKPEELDADEVEEEEGDGESPWN